MTRWRSSTVPAETGYVAASEALVDIRATLAEATACGLLSPALRDALAAGAKRLPYPDRGFAPLLAAARRDEPAQPALDALERWLPAGRVEQKRADAEALLATMRAFLASDPPPFAADFRLEASAAWRGTLAAARSTPADQEPTLADLVWDEARLTPGGVGRHAVGRLHALAAADRRGIAADEGTTRAVASALRRERGLSWQRDLAAWLEARDLDLEGWAGLADDEARLELLAAMDAPDAGNCLLDLFRLEGGYPELRALALAKRDGLATVAMPPLDDAAVHELAAWHAVLGGQPAPTDADAYARGLGFRDGADLARALWRDRAWRRGRPAGAIGPGSRSE